MQQDQNKKQLQKKQKELKEEYGARTNQKTNFQVNMFGQLNLWCMYIINPSLTNP